jgi:CheY-like chemotaxis protein
MVDLPRKRLIFAVDDEPDILDLIHAVLAAAGHMVESFSSAEKLLERMKKKPKPDLVLLDIMMPVVDGYEACRQIRKHPGFSSLPIIFLTAKTQDKDYFNGLAAGGTSYIEKPFDVDRLDSIIAPFLSGRRKKP